MPPSYPTAHPLPASAAVPTTIAPETPAYHQQVRASISRAEPGRSEKGLAVPFLGSHRESSAAALRDGEEERVRGGVRRRTGWVALESPGGERPEGESSFFTRSPVDVPSWYANLRMPRTAASFVMC